MASDWPIVCIEDIAEKIAMGPFGSNIKVETFVETGIPIISGAHLRGVRMEDDNFNFVTDEHAEKMKNSNVFRGDVIFTHAGNIGQVAYIPLNSQYERYVISQRQFYLRCDLSKADPAFISYFFHSSEGQHKLLANASQTGVPSIARPSSYLKTIELSLPPLTEQRAIAHILGTLDDKIELNRKQNETLEAMARALFKAWFVDFEPVRAKCRGEFQTRPYQWPQHILDLFPDRLVESELGEIPDGWKVGTISDVFSLRNERKKPSKETSSLPYVPIESISAKNPFLSEWMEGSNAKSSLTLFKYGDILFGAMRPYFHKVCIAPFDGVTRTTVFTLTPINPKTTPYSLMLAYQDETVEWATLNSEGSTIPYAKWKNSFERMPIVLPPENLQAHFSDAVASFLEKGNENIQQTRSLAQLRDTLLPKLISGELRVKDAEAFLKERGL